ncbi:MAG: uroporphyrinogen-III synthase, partial [Deltaproteobacteria bacterium]
ACIGPVTAAAVKKAGLRIDIMQERYTIPGLVEALVDFFAANRASESGPGPCIHKTPKEVIVV